MLSCKSLRAGIRLSGILLLAGFLTEFLSAYGLLPTVTGSYLGFYLTAGALLVLLTLFVVSLLPSVARRLAECER